MGVTEEEKKAVEKLKSIVKVHNDFMKDIKREFINSKEIKALETALNLIENQQKELTNIKEIEKAHKEENGKLRVELEQEKEKNKELEKENIDIKEKSRQIAENLNYYIHKDKIKEIYNILGEYRHYTTPTIEQNEENENAVDKAVDFIEELLEEK